MQNETDDGVAVSIIFEAKEHFGSLSSCSFDREFNNPHKQEELIRILDNVILPHKGKLSAINKEIKNSEEFKEACCKNSAVESSINALKNNGLYRCLDHGIEGFKRYVALSVLVQNIQIIGHIYQQKQLKSLQKLKKRQGEKFPVTS